MTPFHIALHAIDNRAAPAGSPLNHGGRAIKTLNIDGLRKAAPFQTSFEEMAEQLAAFDRLFFEPDGSFVWTGESVESRRWQIDGLLCDHLDQIRYIELKGWCPEQSFKRFTGLLRHDEATQLGVQLIREARLLKASEFHRLVWQD